MNFFFFSNKSENKEEGSARSVKLGLLIYTFNKKDTNSPVNTKLTAEDREKSTACSVKRN